MAKTLLIVEDNNDKLIFEAIIRHIKLPEIEIKEIEWEFVAKENNPQKPVSLIKRLKTLRPSFSKGIYDKVGIIMDMDNSTISNMLETVNIALQYAYPNDVIKKLNSINQFITMRFEQAGTNNENCFEDVQFACHFVNLNGKGEIEDILKAIKKQNSPVADCVDEHLKECLKNKNEELRDKDLVKIWINHYQRYDTLAKEKRNYTNTTWESVMQKRASDLFDFDIDLIELNGLKNFLNLMN